MSTLTQIEWLVLNETLDDAENLEQIYRALAFEFALTPTPAPDSAAAYWRESDAPIRLADIADAIHSLVERKLLIVRHDPADSSAMNDLSYVWRSWFEAGPEARALCSAHRAEFGETRLTVREV